jgi:hypothetical protein
MRLASILLISTLCACSQSINITQPPATTSRFVSDTIDFGIDPLWREADTTFSLLLPSHNAISSIVFSDSNFTLLDTSRINDSLRISLRFQPQSLANHSGYCLLLSKQDTLARFSLFGKASPFERKVGDSYVYAGYHRWDLGDVSQTIDSVWIEKLPMHFRTNDSHVDYGTAGDIWGAAGLTASGDWKTFFFLIPVVTIESFDSTGNDYHTSHYSTPDTIILSHFTARSVGSFEHVVHRYGQVRTEDEYDLSGTYCRDIGNFLDLRVELHHTEYLGTQVNINSYHLLRFHLRR